jgi:hypothetical protein
VKIVDVAEFSNNHWGFDFDFDYDIGFWAKYY